MSVVVWVQDWNMELVTFIYQDVFLLCSVFDVLSVKIVKSFWYCYSWKKKKKQKKTKQIQICKGVQFIFPIGLTFLRKREGEKKEKRKKRKGEWQDVMTWEWWRDRKWENEQGRENARER